MGVVSELVIADTTEAESIVSGSDEGAWGDVLPSKMLAAFSRIASFDDDGVQSLSEYWSKTDEFNACDEAEVRSLIREIGDLAETALLQCKTLFLWTAL